MTIATHSSFLPEFLYLWVYRGLLFVRGSWQGLDDDDTPGTSVVEAQYAFVWYPAPWYGRIGRGVGAYRGGDYLEWMVQQGWTSWDSYMSDWHSLGVDPANVSLWTAIAAYAPAATVGYFPATGLRESSTGVPFNVATSGFVWSSALYASDVRSAAYLYAQTSQVAASFSAARSYGLSVRCVQKFTRYFFGRVNENVVPSSGVLRTAICSP